LVAVLDISSAVILFYETEDQKSHMPILNSYGKLALTHSRNCLPL